MQLLQSPTTWPAGGAGGRTRSQNHAARLQLSRGFTSVKLVPDYELVLLADGAFGASLRHSEGGDGESLCPQPVWKLRATSIAGCR